MALGDSDIFASPPPYVRRFSHATSSRRTLIVYGAQLHYMFHIMRPPALRRPSDTHNPLDTRLSIPDLSPTTSQLSLSHATATYRPLMPYASHCISHLASCVPASTPHLDNRALYA